MAGEPDEYVVLEAPSLFRWKGPKQGLTMFSATGGRLTLTSRRLVFSSTRETDDIPLAAMTRCELTGRLRNLTVHYREEGGRDAARTFGTQSLGMPLATQWLDAIEAARAGSPPATAPAQPNPLTPDEARERLRDLRRRTGVSEPGAAELPAQLAALASLLSCLDADDAATAVLAAASRPDDASSLFQAGYQLIDLGLGDLAAAPLRAAHRLRPDEPSILSELVVALERCERYADAVAAIEQAPGAVDRSDAVRALYALNVAMTGDFATAERLAPTLSRDGDLGMLADIATARAERFAALGRPAEIDLRAWELLAHGMLVLDLAGPEYEGMSGRWAAVWDSPAALASRLTILEHVLGRRESPPSVVAYAPDRDSEVLAWTIGTRLGTRVVSALDDVPPGALVVAFSWHDARPRGELLDDRSATLFAYSLDWTRDAPAPDVVGLEAQALFPAWGEGSRVVGTPGTPDARIETTPADTRPAEIVGRELAGVAVGTAETIAAVEAMMHIDALLDPIVALRAPTGLTTGERQRFSPGGPIRSARFG